MNGDTTIEEVTTTPPPADTPAEAITTDKEQPGPVPYTRFKEVNSELATLKKKLEGYEKEQSKRQKETEEAEKKRLAEGQEWQKLAEKNATELQGAQTTLTTLTEQNGRYKTVVSKLLKAEMAAVPEIFHGLLSKMDEVEQLEWIATNKDKLLQKVSLNGIPATPSPKGQGQLTDEDRRARTARTF